MKKKAFLAALALCLAFTATACSMDQLTGRPAGNQETADSGQTESTHSYTDVGTRIVTVDNVEKYIRIADYKGLNLDNSPQEITDDQVDAQIAFLLKDAREDVKDIGSPVQPGDQVTISYVCLQNGKVVETASLYDLVVGDGSMVEGFEEGLSGMKKGETRELTFTLPEDFYPEELSGQQVTYRVTLLTIARIPKLNDTWVAANTDVKTVAEYREKIRQEMKASVDAEAEDNLRRLAWDIILTNSEVIEFPKPDLDNAMDEFRSQVMKYNNESGMALEDFVKSQGMTMESFEEQCRQYAESKVKQNLLIQGIMDAEGLRLEDEESLAIQEQLVAEFGASSLAQLIDSYGQTMIDEAIGLIRAEDFIVANAAHEATESNAEGN